MSERSERALRKTRAMDFREMAADIMATSTTKLTLFHSIRLARLFRSCSIKKPETIRSAQIRRRGRWSYGRRNERRAGVEGCRRWPCDGHLRHRRRQGCLRHYHHGRSVRLHRQGSFVGQEVSERSAGGWLWKTRNIHEPLLNQPTQFVFAPSSLGAACTTTSAGSCSSSSRSTSLR